MTKLDPGVRQFFLDKNFAFLVTRNPDGSFHVTPTWVDTDGRFILINTVVGRIKHRNVTRDPRVGISMVEQANPYKTVSLSGRVVEQVVGKKAEDHIDKLAKKYRGTSTYRRRRPGDRRVILKIAVDRVYNFMSF